MPNVLEIEETLTEIQEQPSYKAPQPTPPRPSLANKITAALKGMTAHRSERPYENMECYATPEMPLDTLARKHPYMYADALLG
jgi:hypothetical protein